MNTNRENRLKSKSALTLAEYEELYAAKSIDTQAKQNKRSFQLFYEHHRANEKPKSFLFQSATFGPNSVMCLISFLEKRRNVRVLNLSGNNIGDEGIAAVSNYIASNNDLIQLDVSGCGLSDFGCACLFKAMITNKSIIQLNVYSISGTGRNIIGNEATIQLNRMLSKNKVLQSVDVSLTEINSEKVVTISSGLRFNSSMSSINLSCNMIRSKGTSTLIRGLNGSSIRELYLSDCKINDNAAPAFIHLFNRNRRLKVLDLSKNSLSFNFCSSIAQSFMGSSIESFNISSNNLGRGDLSIFSNAISHNQFLKILNISNCKLSSQDLRIIMKYNEINETLTDFIANKNMFFDECGQIVANFIESSGRISFMSFDMCELNDRNTKEIFKAMENSKSLVKLSVKMNSLKDPNPIIDCLLNNKDVLVLDIDGNDIEYKSYQKINRLIRENRMKYQKCIENTEDKEWILERARRSIEIQREMISNYAKEKGDLSLALEQLIDIKRNNINNLGAKLKNLSEESVKCHEEQISELDVLEHKKGYLESEVEIMNNEFKVCDALHNKHSRILKEVEDKIAEEESKQNEEFKKININRGTAIMMYKKFKESIISDWKAKCIEKEKAKRKTKRKKGKGKKSSQKVKDTGLV